MPAQKDEGDGAIATEEKGVDGDDDGADGADLAQGEEQKEQRVLEPLEGQAAGWLRVLDTGSGSVYFWNEETNKATSPASFSPPSFLLKNARRRCEPVRGNESFRFSSTSRGSSGL